MIAFNPFLLQHFFLFTWILHRYWQGYAYVLRVLNFSQKSGSQQVQKPEKLRHPPFLPPT